MTWRLPRSSAAPGPKTSRLGLAVVAVLLVFFFSVRHENFFTADNAIAIGVNVAAVAIAGFGTAILLITGNVDLSIGSMYGFVSMAVAQVAVQFTLPGVPVVAGLLLGLVLGAINGALVLRLKISPLIVTVGLLAVYRGLAYVVSSAPVFGFSDSFLAIGRGRVAGVPIPIVVAVIVVGIIAFCLTRTVLGLRIYAVGGDPRAADRAGIRVGRHTLAAYAFNGMLIGLIAVLTTSRLGSGSPTTGVGFEFDVLTAVILGGVAFAGGAGRPFGVIVGVVTIGIVNAGLVFEGLQGWYQDIAKGSILVVALAADQISAARHNARLQRMSRQSDPPATDDPETGAGHPTRPTFGGGHAAALPPTAPALEAEGVGKSFGAVTALSDVSLQVRNGEVLGLLGDNGAGKSTLVQIVSGAAQPDEGEIRMAGSSVHFRNPGDARESGVETVYQDLALCPNLSVVHNLILGGEPTKRLLGLIRVRDDNVANEIAKRRLAGLGTRIHDVNQLVERLSGGQRQAVAIARTLSDDVRVVILDEPTAALGMTQTDNVLRATRSLADRGSAVLMITHDMASVMKVCDRVLVLRQGRVAFSGPTRDLSQLQLLQLMAGGDLPEADDSQPAGEQPRRNHEVREAPSLSRVSPGTIDEERV